MMSSNNKKKVTKINKNGQVEISDGDDDNNNNDTSSSSSSSFFLSSARTTTLDVFGFNLDLRQFCITLALCSLMLGTQGTLALLMALGAYTLFMRVTASSRSNNTTTSRGSGSSSWRSFGGGGGGGGPRNIRRISDLPCDPKIG